MRSPLAPLKKGGTGSELRYLTAGEMRSPLAPLKKGGTGSELRYLTAGEMRSGHSVSKMSLLVLMLARFVAAKKPGF
jgi:hypothetical protein